MTRTRILALTVLLIAAPFTVSFDEGIQSNDACAAGESCCSELGSTCVINGQPTRNAYYSTKGCVVQT